MFGWGAEQALLWAQYNLKKDPTWYERIMARAGLRKPTQKDRAN